MITLLSVIVVAVASLGIVGVCYWADSPRVNIVLHPDGVVVFNGRQLQPSETLCGLIQQELDKWEKSFLYQQLARLKSLLPHSEKEKEQYGYKPITILAHGDKIAIHISDPKRTKFEYLACALWNIEVSEVRIQQYSFRTRFPMGSGLRGEPSAEDVCFVGQFDGASRDKLVRRIAGLHRPQCVICCSYDQPVDGLLELFQVLAENKVGVQLSTVPYDHSGLWVSVNENCFRD